MLTWKKRKTLVKTIKTKQNLLRDDSKDCKTYWKRTKTNPNKEEMSAETTPEETRLRLKKK